MIMFTTDRLEVRIPTEDHLKEFTRTEMDPVVREYIGSGPLTAEKTQEVLVKAISHWEEHRFTIGPVYEKETGAFIGRAGVIHLGFDRSREVEVGYALLQDYWGKGYATELAKGAVKWAFETFFIEELVGVTHPENHASQRVLLKAGMSDRGFGVYPGGAKVRWFAIERPESIQEAGISS